MSEQKKTEKAEGKYLPGIGVDVGTSNIVIARQCEDGSFFVRHHRNMLFEMEANDESSDLLERSDYLYIKTADKYYIVGEDALKLVNALGRGEIVRPMQNGLMNPTLKKAQTLLNYILEAVVGKPQFQGEPLRFSVPANPIDKLEVNNLFHQTVLAQFFTNLGFSPKPINEALSNLYNEAPSMEVEGEGTFPLTGFSISFGGGMTNCCLALRGMSLVEFSSTQCGDHIDRQTAVVTGEPVAKVMRVKEKKFNLESPDQSDRIQQALSIYYDEMVSRVVKNMLKEFAKESREFAGPIEVVVCGGTAMIPGFMSRFDRVLGSLQFPFTIKGSRLSATPFFSVSRGCALAARGDHKKMKKE